jgi:hypothetical protein
MDDRGSVSHKTEFFRRLLGGNANPRLGLGLSQDRFKRGIVSGLVKQREPPDTTVQNMIREVPRSKARVARHAKVLPTHPPSVKKRLPTPFILAIGFSHSVGFEGGVPSPKVFRGTIAS